MRHMLTCTWLRTASLFNKTQRVKSLISTVQHTMRINFCELQENGTDLVSHDRSSLPCPVMKRKKQCPHKKDVYHIVTNLLESVEISHCT